MDAKKVFIVSHTHWDREWYLTFHRFRVNLVRILRLVLDRLEEGGAFRHFVLDGQAKILEDHVEIHPEDAERIRDLVEAGSLSIGPWYILPDEFLVSGESTVRNLLLGHRVSAGFGGARKVGYMPDSFGHIAQMPQILRGGGIDSFIYTRGNGDEIDDLGDEFTWRAPDGSEVMAIHQRGGYCNAGGLGFEELWHAHTRRAADPARAVEKVRDLLAMMAETSNTDVRLLNNGCDHFPPQQAFGEILTALREAFPDVRFAHTGFSEYLDVVRASGAAKKTFTGEFLGGRHHHILSGVWSARMYLKQRNDEAETLLAGTVEPARAAAWFLHGLPYPREQVEAAWKLLLLNHPHDSICGCSTDEVHREMETRSTGVLETGEELLSESLAHLVPSFGRRADDDRATVLAVVNPLPYSRTEVVERLVVFQPFGTDMETLDLVDDRGNRVEFEVAEKRYVERFWGIDYRAEPFVERQRERFGVYADLFGDRILRPESEKDERDCFAVIRFVAEDLPGVGHRTYAFREGGAGPTVLDQVVVSADTIENGRVRVRLHPDGTFDLTDLETGDEYPGQNALEDTEDAGDEYDYSPASASRTIRSKGSSGSVAVVEAGGLRGALSASFVLGLPQGLTRDRSRRAAAQVDCPVRVTVTVDAMSPLVTVETRFTNLAEDHRLRAEFPAPFTADEIVSDGHFQVVARPVDTPEKEHWVQPPPDTRPQREYSLLTDGERGLAVLNRGLPEVAAHRDGESRTILSLTLLRAVGWLSRDDFPTRRCQNAGPTLYTPEAQCQGEQTIRYAIMPFRGDPAGAGIRQASERFRIPVAVKQGVADGSIEGGRGLLSKRSLLTSVTAVKRCEDRDTLIVRVVNLSGEPVEESLTLGVPVAGAWRTNLLEERQGELDVTGNDVALPLRAHEIATVEVALTVRCYGP